MWGWGFSDPDPKLGTVSYCSAAAGLAHTTVGVVGLQPRAGQAQVARVAGDALHVEALGVLLVVHRVGPHDVALFGDLGLERHAEVHEGVQQVVQHDGAEHRLIAHTPGPGGDGAARVPERHGEQVPGQAVHRLHDVAEAGEVHGLLCARALVQEAGVDALVEHVSLLQVHLVRRVHGEPGLLEHLGRITQQLVVPDVAEELGDLDGLGEAPQLLHERLLGLHLHRLEVHQGTVGVHGDQLLCLPGETALQERVQSPARADDHLDDALSLGEDEVAVLCGASLGEGIDRRLRGDGSGEVLCVRQGVPGAHGQLVLTVATLHGEGLIQSDECVLVRVEPLGTLRHLVHLRGHGDIAGLPGSQGIQDLGRPGGAGDGPGLLRPGPPAVHPVEHRVLTTGVRGAGHDAAVTVTAQDEEVVQVATAVGLHHLVDPVGVVDHSSTEAGHPGDLTRGHLDVDTSQLGQRHRDDLRADRTRDGDAGPTTILDGEGLQVADAQPLRQPRRERVAQTVECPLVRVPTQQAGKRVTVVGVVRPELRLRQLLHGGHHLPGGQLLQVGVGGLDHPGPTLGDREQEGLVADGLLVLPRLLRSLRLEQRPGQVTTAVDDLVLEVVRGEDHVHTIGQLRHHHVALSEAEQLLARVRVGELAHATEVVDGLVVHRTDELRLLHGVEAGEPDVAARLTVEVTRHHEGAIQLLVTLDQADAQSTLPLRVDAEGTGERLEPLDRLRGGVVGGEGRQAHVLQREVTTHDDDLAAVDVAEDHVVTRGQLADVGQLLRGVGERVHDHGVVTEVVEDGEGVTAHVGAVLLLPGAEDEPLHIELVLSH